MTKPDGSSYPSERERRLNAALAEYLEAAEAGTPPGPAEWLGRYPEFRAELEEFLALRDQFATHTGARDAAPPVDGAASTMSGPGPDGSTAGDPETRADKFAGYEVRRELGRGGMGVVYLVRDTRLN